MKKKIHIPKREIWDESKEEFLNYDECDITILHSLVSMSRWEAKYHKPYLNSEKTAEETIDYIRMMVVDDVELDDKFFLSLPKEIMQEVADYINDPMTATTFSEKEDKSSNSVKNEIITSELIYYWMTAQNIPFECENWHINRLITLVKVCAIKNQPEDKKKKRMTSSDLALRRARMEAARAKYKH